MCAMLFVYKIKNGICPTYLRENVSTNEIAEHNLRNNNHLRIQRVRTARGQRTIQYMGFQTFNSLPNSVKTSENVFEFKRKILNYIRLNIH